MNFNRKVILYIKENRWIIIASIFFILWKFLLIGILWNERSTPPEPDDSWTYISQISSVTNCQKIFCNTPTLSTGDYTGFIYFSYRIFFGIISKLFHISALEAYHFGFYLGTIAMLFVLFFFFKKLTKDKNLIAFSIFFLSLYHGTGETHGFFWVVPSFFALLLFILIFSIYIDRDNKFWPVWFVILTPIFILSHPISIYLVALFLIFLVIYCWLIRKIDKILIKKTILILIISFFCYFAQSHYLKQFSQKNYLGIENSMEEIKKSIQNNVAETNKENQKQNISSETKPDSVISANMTSGKKQSLREYLVSFISPKVNILSVSYFKWFFPNWLGFFPLIIFLLMLFLYKQFEILSFYFSSFIFFVSATILNEYGYRSAIILWLATFVLYSFGTWFLFNFIKNRIKNKLLKRIFFGTVLSGLLIFIFINVAYSLLYAKNMNTRYKYNIENTFIDYIILNTSKGDPVSAPRMIRFYDSDTPLPFHNPLSSPEESKYLIQLKYQDKEKELENNILRKLFDQILGILHVQKQKNIQHISPEIPENFVLEKEFGSIQLYKNKLWNQ